MQSETADSATETKGCGGGCAYLLVGALVGIVFAYGLAGSLVDMWTYCTHDMPPDLVMVNAPHEGLAIWLPFLVLRCPLYGAAFVLGGRTATRAVRIEVRVGRVAVAFLGGLVLCVVLFVLDFSLFNGMPSGAGYLPRLCPNGHLPWWPL